MARQVKLFVLEKYDFTLKFLRERRRWRVL